MENVRWLLFLGLMGGCVAEGPNDFAIGDQAAFTTPLIGWLETRDDFQPMTVHEIDARRGAFENVEQMRARKLDARLWPIETTAPGSGGDPR